MYLQTLDTCANLEFAFTRIQGKDKRGEGKIRGQRGGEMKIFTISFAIYIYIIYTHIYIGLIERADFSRFRSIFKHAHCHSREESSPRQDLRFSCLSRAHGPSNLASFQKSFHPPFFVCSSRINLDINEN